MTLDEYAATIKIPDISELAEPMIDQDARAPETLQVIDPQRASELKVSIKNQLEDGTAPEIILYTAINYIGLEDPEWALDAIGLLNNLYADLEQQCLFWNERAESQKRLNDKQRKTNKRIRKELERRIRDYQSLQENAREALTLLDKLDYNWESD